MGRLGVELVPQRSRWCDWTCGGILETITPSIWIGQPLQMMSGKWVFIDQESTFTSLTSLTTLTSYRSEPYRGASDFGTKHSGCFRSSGRKRHGSVWLVASMNQERLLPVQLRLPRVPGPSLESTSDPLCRPRLTWSVSRRMVS